MMILLWILCIASIIGSALYLVLERQVAVYNRAVPPWPDACPPIEPYLEGSFGRRS
ncbi:hypothetical protein [Dehalogenimonas sp. 4OHTPN]|uniref:Uncharacterized protein n=1 Tax=Dehalogenimonas sp. 4OHTPN TaxID=3166643 RepID=A0AAU8GA61_9CHLR